MAAAGVAADVVTYNTIVSAHAKLGQLDRAERFVRQMEDAGVKPNLVTFLSLAQAQSRAGLPENVMQTISHMLKRGIRPDARFMSALLLAWTHVPPPGKRSPKQASVQFQQLVQRGVPVDQKAMDALGRAIGRKYAAQLCSELGLSPESSDKTSLGK